MIQSYEFVFYRIKEIEMLNDLRSIASEIGLSESLLTRYYQIGLFDDMNKNSDKWNNKKNNHQDIIRRVKNIQSMQKKDIELKQILYKTIPISIYNVSIENGDGRHNIDKRLHFTLVLSDKLEGKFFLDKPQDFSPAEMKEYRDILIEMGDYSFAEKLRVGQRNFTFLFEDFEEILFDENYLNKQRMLRSIRIKVKPLQWVDVTEGKWKFNEIYSDDNQYKNFQSCLHFFPTVKHSNPDKYAIRYSIGLKYIDSIEFKQDYKYLKDRINKMYKSNIESLNISEADNTDINYSTVSILASKEKNLLNIIKDNSYETIRIQRKNKNILTVNAKKKQYSIQNKKIIIELLEKDYKNVSWTRNGKTYYINEADQYKF